MKIGNGHYIMEGSHEYYSALLVQEHNLQLPASYYYRTSKTDNFTGNKLAYSEQDIKYIEIFTEDIIIPTQIEWSENAPFVYDGTEKSITAKIKNKADGDIVELVLSENTATDAGVYTATVTGLTGKDAAKYTLDGAENLTISWEITKGEQAAPTTPIGVDTTYIDTNDGKITGVDSTMEYRKDGDTNYTAVTGTEITGLAAGTYYVRFAANVNYSASPEIRIVVALGDKRTPTIDTDPTASRVIIGGKLSDSTLTGGVASVPGEFAWVNPDAVMNTAGKFDMLVRFTPTDTETYKTVDFEIEVEVVVCDTASGEHDFTEQTNNADEHWTICAKCKAEQPGSRDDHKGGSATCTARAECSECGEAYGAEPSHGEFEIRNAKQTSCKEEGYTGDKHCKICGEKLETGTAIAKTAHDYENGKCKACGATDPNYHPDVPPTGDNSHIFLWTGLMFFSALGIVALAVFSRKRNTY